MFDRSNAVAQGTDFTASAITGSGSVVQIGSGTTTLLATANNSYSGGTIVDGGILSLPPTGVGTGVIRGSLTINSGATVKADALWALGFNSGTCVTAITINGGTLNFTGAGNGGGTAAASITMTGGTISNSGTSGTTFDWYNNSDSPNPFLDTLPSSTTATVSSGINLRLKRSNQQSDVERRRGHGSLRHRSADQR